MKLLVRIFLFGLLVSTLLGCTEASSPTSVPTLSPSPELQPTPEITSTEGSAATLTAGQWNYLFFHPPRNQVVLVNGGPDRGKPATDPLELWAWDGFDWSLLSADPEGPAWRNFGGAAYDSKRDRLVIYGGVQDRDSRMEETWEWDGTNWTRFDVAGPGYREGAAMVYDEARGNTILYGGANEKFEILGDTWAWDGSAWTQVSTTGPTSRFPSAFVYDAARERVLLFSGHFVDGNSYINFSDFWEWDGASWKEIIVEGEKPGARNIAAMVYHPLEETVLLFGGGEESFTGEVWSWNGEAWTQAAESGAPARSGLGGAYDVQRKWLVVFGGVEKPGGKAITDTWEWDGKTWVCVYRCK